MKVHLPSLPPDVPEKIYLDVYKIEYDYDLEQVTLILEDKTEITLPRNSFWKLEVW